MQVGNVSFWYAEDGLPQIRRPALQGAQSADVAIIGAGYTGLWTAYYLIKARPDLKVVVLEKEFAGYGASGRNGGWCMGTLSWDHAAYARQSSRQAVLAMVAALEGTVPQIAAVCAAEGIKADLRACDELTVATSPAQMARLEQEAAHAQLWGMGHRVKLLSAAQTAQRIAIPGALGASVTSGMMRVQPAKLVRGLADVAERAGAVICEGTEVLSYAPGIVTTARGRLEAKTIFRCTEGFTASLPGHKRTWLPLNSAQIVTEPLPPEVWAQIGWQGHELFGDAANSYCYCQRTADGRITVGARGVPYRYGSKIDKDGAPDARTIARLTEVLRRHFPAAAACKIDHAWCGVIGVPRDWCATVGLDPATGLGWAGGYVGVGVSTANLAGRTLADLALGRQSDLTALPWVNRKVRAWEREPLRWLAVQAMYRLFSLADAQEDRGANLHSRWASIANWVSGRR